MNKKSPPKTAKASKARMAKAPAKAAAGRKTKASKRAQDVRREAKPRVDGEIRQAMIAQAAYFRAEKRGFGFGGELDDWFEAEREISRILDE